MKNTYISTYISGFEECVKEFLPLYLSDVKVEKLLNGLVVYTTSMSIDSVLSVGFFNNTFLLIKEYSSVMSVGELISMYARNDLVRLPVHCKTFRVFVSDQNQMVSIDSKKMEKIENDLSAFYKMRANRNFSQTEFWFIYRSENIGFLAMRLKTEVPKLNKGELKPQLANFMCLLSNPDSQDIFLDPFAGYGAIPIARKYFDYTQIVAIENSAFYYNKFKQNIKSKNINILLSDFFTHDFKDVLFNKLVTDPPWGIFDSTINVESFYSHMIKRFAEISTRDAVIVMLTAQKDLLENIISDQKTFIITRKINILVSGKKSAIYVLKK